MAAVAFEAYTRQRRVLTASGLGRLDCHIGTWRVAEPAHKGVAGVLLAR